MRFLSKRYYPRPGAGVLSRKNKAILKLHLRWKCGDDLEAVLSLFIVVHTVGVVPLDL